LVFTSLLVVSRRGGLASSCVRWLSSASLLLASSRQNRSNPLQLERYILRCPNT
jgi:hypothetical protein